MGSPEPGQRRVRDIVQGVAAEQGVAYWSIPPRCAPVNPPAGAEAIGHAEAVGQFDQWLTGVLGARHRVQDLVQSHHVCAGRANDMRQPANVQAAILACPTMDIIAHHPDRLVSPLVRQLHSYSSHTRRARFPEFAGFCRESTV